MNLVIRPVNDVFLEEVAFPALAVGVVDAASGLGKLLESIADERVAWLLGRVLDRTVGGSFFGLVDDEWLELVHVLLFSEWERRRDGWHVSHEHPGYAASYELALHVALMLQDPSYPYADAHAAERFRDEWLGKVIKSGLVALVAGIWDPFPTFPPDQVLVTLGRSTYAPSEDLAIADWSYRPSHAVKSWERRLDDQLKNLVGRERCPPRTGEPARVGRAARLLDRPAPRGARAERGLQRPRAHGERVGARGGRAEQAHPERGGGWTRAHLAGDPGGWAGQRVGAVGLCSSRMVTGPSLTSATCISAAKTPSSTCTPSALSASHARA